MNSTELLMPAGNIEKLQTAIAYGADAVYLGLVDYSLRTMKSGSVIDKSNIKSAIEIAHSQGKKAYCTVNIFAHNSNIKALKKTLKSLKMQKLTLLLSVIREFSTWQKNSPGIPLHISTQANTLNYEAVKFWQDLGASRIILAKRTVNFRNS
jgi:putative protease